MLQKWCFDVRPMHRQAQAENPGGATKCCGMRHVTHAMAAAENISLLAAPSADLKNTPVFEFKICI